MSTEFFQFGPDNTEIIALKDFNFPSKNSKCKDRDIY